jgi:16S rRNA (guanine966-N2)-methyltransferase
VFIRVISGSRFVVLRIIAGKFRGRNLKSPPSLEVRPTSDRLRETLFNVIAPRIRGAEFLDLCAGSGAVGIEALSRDAAHATFVDRARPMCELIKSNLGLCRIDEHLGNVVQSDAANFLQRAGRAASSWDIIFYDPPYANDYLSVLEIIGASPNLLNASGLLVVEHHHKTVFEEVIGRLHRSRTLKQGDSSLSFFENNTDQLNDTKSDELSCALVDRSADC